MKLTTAERTLLACIVKVGIARVIERDRRDDRVDRLAAKGLIERKLVTHAVTPTGSIVNEDSWGPTARGRIVFIHGEVE